MSLTGVLARERLFAALDRVAGHGGRPAPVALVHAPTGAGKTALVASWAARCADRAASGDGAAPLVVVIPLDDRHGEPAALSEAVHDAVVSADGSPLARLIPRPRRTAAPVSPLCLVLDDADVLAGRPAARLLATLARHPSLRLVLVGRTPPPLRPWLRARGRLHEIGAEDLAFTEREAAELLRAHRVVLSPEDLAVLLRRTRGSAAGLRLAATSLTARGTPVVRQVATAR
ncbi:AAA family ATPase [Actinosynnema sp. CS-041913]|uniref:AAA family ATPase n=1 Tax=Actinosynnema sp. CS-041913 TaxID=3239917 RepID=UPI003D925C76